MPTGIGGRRGAAGGSRLCPRRTATHRADVARLGSTLPRSRRGGMAGCGSCCADRQGSIGFTPDGPKGPVGVAQPGVILAAAATGLPIQPVALAASRCRRLRRGTVSSYRCGAASISSTASRCESSGGPIRRRPRRTGAAARRREDAAKRLHSERGCDAKHDGYGEVAAESAATRCRSPCGRSTTVPRLQVRLADEGGERGRSRDLVARSCRAAGSRCGRVRPVAERRRPSSSTRWSSRLRRTTTGRAGVDRARPRPATCCASPSPPRRARRRRWSEEDQELLPGGRRRLAQLVASRERRAAAGRLMETG